MRKWEYMVHFVQRGRTKEQIEGGLNESGQDGWELATVYTDPAGHLVFVLKRAREAN